MRDECHLVVKTTFFISSIWARKKIGRNTKLQSELPIMYIQCVSIECNIHINMIYGVYTCKVYGTSRETQANSKTPIGFFGVKPSIHPSIHPSSPEESEAPQSAKHHQHILRALERPQWFFRFEGLGGSC